MAEEKPEGAESVDEPTAAPAEAVEEPENQEEQPSPYDELAQKMGWTPKDQFKGDPQAWKSAEQFILDGNDIQRQQSRDLREMRSTVDNIAKTSAQILADRIEQEKAQLAEQYSAAVEDGDATKSFEIARKITSLDQRTPTQGPSTETQEFVQRNRWFNSDPLATVLAVETCEKLKHLPVSQQLEAAEKEVRRVYPQLFPAAKPPPGVSAPQSRGGQSAPKAKGFADLTKAEQDIAKDMVERKVIPNVDAYVKYRFADEGKAA